MYKLMRAKNLLQPFERYLDICVAAILKIILLARQHRFESPIMVPLKSLLIALGCLLMANRVSAQKVDLWLGTGGGHGIYHATFDTDNGNLSKPRKLDTLGGAGFLTLHPTKNLIYATAVKNKKPGVASYQIEGSGNSLKLVENGFVPSSDRNAAHIAIDQTGKVVMSAQYGGGSVCTYLTNDTGAVASLVEKVEHGEGSKAHPRRQKTAHPHWVGTSPDNQLMLVPDLGRDAVVIYRLDAQTGKLKRLAEIHCPGGPRHMKFHPNGKLAYVLSELSLKVHCFRFDAKKGTFSPIQAIETLPDSLKEGPLNSAAEIRIHPSGKFLYSSNRGHDSVCVFSINQDNGHLSFVERESIRGSWPRNFNIDPTGKWLVAAGARSDTLTVFKIDPDSGALVFQQKTEHLPGPICVEFSKL